MVQHPPPNGEASILRRASGAGGGRGAAELFNVFSYDRAAPLSGGVSCHVNENHA